MKTTLNLPPQLMKRLKAEAARRGTTMSDLVESALRLLLGRRTRPANLPELPSFRSGGALVDVANRDALYDAMERD